MVACSVKEVLQYTYNTYQVVSLFGQFHIGLAGMLEGPCLLQRKFKWHGSDVLLVFRLLL